MWLASAVERFLREKIIFPFMFSSLSTFLRLKVPRKIVCHNTKGGLQRQTKLGVGENSHKSPIEEMFERSFRSWREKLY